MYRLLLVLDRDSEAGRLYSSVFTKQMGFFPPVFAASPEDAARLIRQESFDAVGVMPGEEKQMANLLSKMDSPLPLFLLQENREIVLKDLRHLLNRLHVDYADESIPLREMVGIVTTELVHNLLDGSMKNPDVVSRWFRMLRKDQLLGCPCRVWELSVPQGEGYLSDRWHYGTQRLESALCKNFFDRADPDADYYLAFLNSCSARMVAIPRDGGGNTEQMDRSVFRSVEDIKDYLDLDILIAGAETVPDLTAAALNEPV